MKKMKNKKAKVFFSKDIEKILENIDFSGLGKKVAVKVHFGEKGCNTYINPELVRKVYEKIKSLGEEASLVECNVLYKGSRTNRAEHLQTARDHGFDMPIDISDGQFAKINSVDKDKQIQSAAELKLGSVDYELVDL
ncbi:DUF362 domain-containing protein [bacterium]|nr:MAG: DUF362 domain-containing protein [bacterium]